MQKEKQEKAFSRVWFYDNGIDCICESVKIPEVHSCIYINDNIKIGYNNCHKSDQTECNFLKYEKPKQIIKIWAEP